MLGNFKKGVFYLLLLYGLDTCVVTRIILAQLEHIHLRVKQSNRREERNIQDRYGVVVSPTNIRGDYDGGNSNTGVFHQEAP